MAVAVAAERQLHWHPKTCTLSKNTPAGSGSGFLPSMHPQRPPNHARRQHNHHHRHNHLHVTFVHINSLASSWVALESECPIPGWTPQEYTKHSECGSAEQHKSIPMHQPTSQAPILTPPATTCSSSSSPFPIHHPATVLNILLAESA